MSVDNSYTKYINKADFYDTKPSASVPSAYDKSAPVDDSPVDYDEKYASFYDADTQSLFTVRDFEYLGGLLKTIDILRHEKLSFLRKSWLIIKLPFLLIGTFMDMGYLLMKTIFLSYFFIYGCLVAIGYLIYALFFVK